MEDLGAYLTQSLINVPALENYIAAKHNFAAAKLTADDAREMVVLTVGNAYLLCHRGCIAHCGGERGVGDLKGLAGFLRRRRRMTPASAPRLDVLRAQVDYQNEQQQLIATTNDLAKDKLALARAIGLPLDQQIRLTDSEPYAALDNLDPQAAFTQALKNRKDLAAASEQVTAAQAQKTSAWTEQLHHGEVLRRLRRHR